MSEIADDGFDGWEPPEEVVSHAGTPLFDDADFFATPPTEIGGVRTAWTTLTLSKQPMNPGTRFFIAALSGLIVGGLIIWLGSLGGGVDPDIAVAGGGGGLVVALMTWFPIRFKHICTYVGEHGIARLTLTKRRDNEPKLDLLVYDQAANLKSSQTRNYYNGIYTGTSYDFTWTDEAGGKLLRLNGTYKSKDGNPKQKDPFHFANQGENFWNAHLADRMQQQLDSQGYVEFAVNKTDAVRVGPGFLEFCIKGETQRVPAEEIKSLNVAGGVFAIHTNDAKWFGSKGKFNFNYSQLANAGMFIFALERLLGYTFD